MRTPKTFLLALLAVLGAVIATVSVVDRAVTHRSVAPPAQAAPPTSQTAGPHAREPMMLYDADAGGSVVRRGSVMIGMTAGGEVRWRLPLAPEDQLPYAVCLQTCPAAEITMGRSATNPPDRADGPRLRIAGPDWRPRAQGPRLAIDRPLLAGSHPARLIPAPAGAAVAGLRGGPVQLPGTDLISALSAEHAAAVLVAPRGARHQRGWLFRHGSDGWRLASVLPLGGGAQSACLNADGGRMAIVGGGPPRTVDLMSERPSPHTIPESRALERRAGICAVSDDHLVTAVMRATATTNETILTVHSGARQHTSVRLTGSLPSGLWISARTGTTAVLRDGAVMLVHPDGHRDTWSGIEAAAPTRGSQLRVVSATGRLTLRSF